MKRFNSQNNRAITCRSAICQKDLVVSKTIN